MVEVLDFYGIHCGPCQRMMPLVDKVSKEYEGRVTIRKVNVDEQHDLVDQYDIRGVPTFLYLKDGVEVVRKMGVYPINTVRETINSLL